MGATASQGLANGGEPSILAEERAAVSDLRSFQFFVVSFRFRLPRSEFS
jgi:hypothetical protein